MDYQYQLFYALVLAKRVRRAIGQPKRQRKHEVFLLLAA
jgi:hypothetical protein